MHDFRQLKVWKEAVAFASSVYALTDNFPKSEMYGITNQIRRASVSISSNIAEGAGRNTDKDFQRFLGYAKGSCYELETQLLISGNLGYAEQQEIDQLMNELKNIEKKIYNLIRSLNVVAVT